MKRPHGEAVKLDSVSIRKLASYAVKHVYQFTSSRPRHLANARQTFLLQTRDLIAARFRNEHQSLAPNGTDANVYPYFIGVFDTVASLLDPTKLFLVAALFLAIDLATSGLLVFLPYLPITGHYFSFLSSFTKNFIGIVGLTALAALIGYVVTHLKFDFRVPGYNSKQSLCTFHCTELYLKFYDYTLNPHIPYAKHAISIDENRKDFKRVGWDPGETARPERDETGNIFFEQVWFPGNHGDIGGGYEDNECRLSDASLHWMTIAATSIPYPIKIDERVLVTHPLADGRSHNEVKTGFGLVTRLTGWTWIEQRRTLPTDNKTGVSTATMHKSVYERFDASEAFVYDAWIPYRPETLRDHIDFSKYYETGAVFPANSVETATAMADDPESRDDVGPAVS